MNIRFDQSGKILACGIPSQIPAAENVIKVDDKDLPKVFLHTFSLGRYNVDPKKKKLVENKQFKMPERPGFPEEMIPPQAKKNARLADAKLPSQKNPAAPRRNNRIVQGCKF